MGQRFHPETVSIRAFTQGAVRGVGEWLALVRLTLTLDEVVEHVVRVSFRPGILGEQFEGVLACWEIEQPLVSSTLAKLGSTCELPSVRLTCAR